MASRQACFVQKEINNMDNDLKTPSRKQFIKLGLSAAAVFTALKFWAPKKEVTSLATVKMLTREGTLVEVPVSALPAKKKKITNKEMQNWIKKNSTL
jgi:hypothetical protein